MSMIIIIYVNSTNNLEQEIFAWVKNYVHFAWTFNM